MARHANDSRTKKRFETKKTRWLTFQPGLHLFIEMIIIVIHMQI